MAQTSSKQCDLCSQEDGKHFCYDCQQALCDLCRKKHEKIPSLVDHKLTNLQQVDLSSFNTKSNCESHRTEFTIYCKTCLCLVCLKCVTSIHAGHEFCDIEKVVSAERQDVVTTITDLKSKVKSLLDLKEQIKCVHLEKNQANAEKVLKDIAETFKDLAQMIEHKKQIKQTEVEDFEELERQQLESFLCNVDSILRKYTRLSEELENLLTMKHDTTFYLCYKTLKNDVENQDSIPDEPTLNEIQSFDAREVYKEILDFINSQFEMRLCGNCVDQGKQIEELMKEDKQSKQIIQRDQLRIDELVTELKVVKSTHLAEINQLQDEKLESEMKTSKKAEETITELQNQLKCLTDKNERLITELQKCTITEVESRIKLNLATAGLSSAERQNQRMEKENQKESTTNKSDADFKLAKKPNSYFQQFRIVLIGQEGSGKSATGNTILNGRQAFLSMYGPRRCTVRTECLTDIVAGVCLTVIDTPALGNVFTRDDEIQREFERALVMSTPGPHAFLWVYPCGRVTQEDIDKLSLISKMFGDQVFDFVIVVMTNTSFLDMEQKIDDLISSFPKPFRLFLRRCGDRILHIDNRRSKEEERSTFKEDLVRQLVVMKNIYTKSYVSLGKYKG